MSLTDQHKKECIAAAARLRINADWKRLREMLDEFMGDFDDTLRTSTDHESIIRAQSARKQLQELIDFVDNAKSPDTRPRVGQGFGN